MKIFLNYPQLMDLSFLIRAGIANGYFGEKSRIKILAEIVNDAIPKALDEDLINMDEDYINEFLENAKDFLDTDYDLIEAIKEMA